MLLKNKNALITGGGQGIGLGIAERLSEEGADVTVIDKNKDLIEVLEQSKQSHPGKINAKLCDLSNSTQTKEVLDVVWKESNQIDIVINNAGIAIRESFTEIEEEKWDEILNINLKSMFIVGQHMAKKMIAHNVSGRIVNIGSKNGLAAGEKLTHYNVSKGGINLLTQSMGVELAKHNIRVNSIAPGFINTHMDQNLKNKDDTLVLTERTPMNRLGTIREVANTALFLVSDESSYITGTTIVVDGGHLANSSDL